MTDLGMHALSTTVYPCVKLWALYPPTKVNLDLLYKETGQEAKFLRLAPMLEKGEYTVTQAWETIYLPAGYLHAVYTMEGGVLTGINWSSAADIEVVKNIFVREISSGNECPEIAFPLIRACKIALGAGDDIVRREALDAWCAVSSLVKKVAKGTSDCKILLKLPQLKGKACKVCGQDWSKHPLQSQTSTTV